MRRLFLCLVLLLSAAAAQARASGATYGMPIETMPAEEFASTVAVDDCHGWGEFCCGCGWLDSTEIFIGGDAYAGLGDFPAGGFGNSFGPVVGINSGYGLGDSGVRAQLGASYGLYDLKGRGGSAESNDAEQQIYITGGLYHRADLCCGERLSWGVVVDAFLADNWGVNSNEVYVGQLRAMAGWAVDPCNELGVWATVDLWDDEMVITGRGRPDVRAANQINLYWEHNWEFGADTMLYAGILDNADVGDWVFGLTGRAPLSCCAALYGGVNYVVPSAATGSIGDAEDSWNAHFGIVFYLGGNSVSPNVGGNACLPLLPVANNGSFVITD